MPQELWCKKMPPNAQLLAVYATQRLAHEAAASPHALGAPPAAELAPLLRTADALGNLLQYRWRSPTSPVEVSLNLLRKPVSWCTAHGQLSSG